MTVQEAYGFCCLAIGAVLVVGQIYVLLRANTAVADVSRATSQATAAAEHNAELLRALRTRMVGDGSADADSDVVQTALSSAEETQAAAQEAEAKADDWRSTLVSNLSSRIPLATAGIVLIILGAVINGYIDLSAGNVQQPA